MPEGFPPLSINPDLALSLRCAPCIHAAFQQAQDNPLIAIAATDARGELVAIDCAVVQPTLVEIIQTRPGVVRGNHRHWLCSEVLTVVSGLLDIYLLCDCPGKHLFCKRMESGTSVHLPPGTAHAIHTLAETTIASVFIDGDPRLDRERIEMVSL
jgi:hypothetical protein